MSSDSLSAIAPQLDFHRSKPVPHGQTVTIAGQTVATTPVFHAYWHFAAERQKVFFRRLQRSNSELTEDPILRLFKFTNAYRASDRVSQFLIKHVIYRSDLPHDATNVFFRILLFKIFNKIETWQLLEQELGELTWERFIYDHFDKTLSRHMEAGNRIYSAAYIMPSAGSSFGQKLKHQNHLRLIQSLIQKDYPKMLGKCRSLQDAFNLLRTVPSFGPFLAYQYATDINYSTLVNFDENEYVVAGPGALDGISKCFVDGETLDPTSVITFMRDNQSKYFSDLEIEFRSLWGRPLQLIDCQNIFCEISKYSRVAFPEFSGTSGRTRIKQKFSCQGPLPRPWYPPKWQLNELIDHEIT